jgi:hypothetical protein
MKRRLVAALMMTTLISSGISVGRAQSPSFRDKVSAKQSRKRKVVLHPGYVRLPEGYQAYRTERMVDAWWGYLVSPDGNFRINISSGMVASSFGTDDDKFVWTKVEGKAKGAIKIGLKRTDKGELMVASGIWINFAAPIKREGDEDLFLEIVRSYRDGNCNGCDEMLSEPASNNGIQRTRNKHLF